MTTYAELECTCGWSTTVEPDDIETTKRYHYEKMAEKGEQGNHNIEVVGEV